MNHALTIRMAKPADAAAMRAIYAPYVETTAISFEYDVPSEEEFTGRIRTVLNRYPWLAAEMNGRIVGYAYASPFKARKAYERAVETSIYVDRNCRGMGVGRQLHDALEGILKEQGILNMCACIAVPNGPDDETLTRGSVHFHEHMGYRMVGQFRNCGYKFGRWYNMVWMEKIIGRHCANPAEFRPVGQIDLP